VTSPRSIEVRIDGQTLTIDVPLTLRRIGGRKRVVSPPGATAWAPPRPEIQASWRRSKLAGLEHNAVLDPAIYYLAASKGLPYHYVAAVGTADRSIATPAGPGAAELDRLLGRVLG